jgi:hypothetical protein
MDAKARGRLEVSRNDSVSKTSALDTLLRKLIGTANQMAEAAMLVAALEIYRAES